MREKLRETDKFKVYNYNESRVSVEVAPQKFYSFLPSSDGITPTVIPMSLDEIRYANNSAAFRLGLLFFDKNDEDALYEELGISNYTDILKNADIEEIILKPTFEGLKRIVDIKELSVIERVLTVLFKLDADGSHDISSRARQIIDTRHYEISHGIKSQIQLTKNDVPVVKSEEVDALKEQNKLMQQQLEQMQKMMAQLMANQNAMATTTPQTDTASETVEEKPKRGRTKKTAE